MNENQAALYKALCWEWSAQVEHLHQQLERGIVLPSQVEAKATALRYHAEVKDSPWWKRWYRKIHAHFSGFYAQVKAARYVLERDALDQFRQLYPDLSRVIQTPQVLNRADRREFKQAQRELNQLMQAQQRGEQQNGFTQLVLKIGTYVTTRFASSLQTWFAAKWVLKVRQRAAAYEYFKSTVTLVETLEVAVNAAHSLVAIPALGLEPRADNQLSVYVPVVMQQVLSIEPIPLRYAQLFLNLQEIVNENKWLLLDAPDEIYKQSVHILCSKFFPGDESAACYYRQCLALAIYAKAANASFDRLCDELANIHNVEDTFFIRKLNQRVRPWFLLLHPDKVPQITIPAGVPSLQEEACTHFESLMQYLEKYRHDPMLRKDQDQHWLTRCARVWKEMQASLSLACRDIDELQLALLQDKVAIARVAETVQVHDRSIEALTTRDSEKDQQIQAQRGEIQAQRGEIQAQREEIQVLQQRDSEKDQQIQAQRGEIQAQRGEIQAQRGEIQVLQQRDSEKDRQLQGQREQIQTQQEQLQLQQAQLQWLINLQLGVAQSGPVPVVVAGNPSQRRRLELEASRQQQVPHLLPLGRSAGLAAAPLFSFGGHKEEDDMHPGC